MKRGIACIFPVAAALVCCFEMFPTEGSDAPAFALPRDGDRLSVPACRLKECLSVNDSMKSVTVTDGMFPYEQTVGISAYLRNGVSAPDTLHYIQESTKYLWVVTGDTLSCLGFENRSTGFSFSDAVDVVRGERGVTVPVSGRIIQYGSTLLAEFTGESAGSIDGGWCLVCGGDTLRDVKHLNWKLEIRYAVSSRGFATGEA